MMKFNVNQNVLVKLTEEGETILKNYFGELRDRLGLPEYEIFYDENGYVQFQMWNLMQIFGDHLHNGCKVPFETTILIEDHHLTKVDDLEYV